MILDLEKLPPDESRIVGDEVVVLNDLAGDERRIRCHIAADVRRVGEAFYIHVSVSGELPTSCHRCLGPVRLRITPAFDVVLQRSREPVAAETGGPVEDFVVLPMGVSRFSLDPHVYENLVVEIPMQIVCAEDCRGLCPGCGANLNTETCRCKRTADSHWNPLKSLKNRMTE